MGPQYAEKLLQIIPNPFFVKDSQERYISCNLAFELFFHVKREDIVGKKDEDIFDKETSDKIKKSYEELRKYPGKQIHELNLKIRGRKRFLQFVLSTVESEDGEEEGFAGIVVDMTLQQKIQHMLMENQKRIDAILSTAKDAIIIVNFNDDIVIWNNAAETMFGYSEDEIRWQSCSDLLQWHLGDKKLNAPLKDLEPYNDLVAIKKNGESVPVDLSITTIEIEKEFFTLAIIRDVTERKNRQNEREEMEKRLRQGQKMEAIGTLAGGIAHDFNNILGVIYGYAEMTQLMVDEDTQVNRNMVQILLAANRARDMIRQILDFSRQSDVEKHPVLIGLLIKETLKFIRMLLPSNIEIVESIKDTLGMILIEPSQMHQILMNLCSNAAHAMTDGGQIKLTLENYVPDEQFYLNYPDYKKKEYFKLTIQDFGKGMDEDTLSRIFEPYFTTKEVGKGTGMGLATVHGIVKSLGGDIVAESKEGYGSTFTLFFPRVEIPDKRDEEADREILQGTERILFIDDEEQLTELWKEILSTIGYSVTAFIDSRKAIKAFTSQPNDFDIVITDQTMPGITGDHLIEEIKKLRPNIPAILCSGFSSVLSDKILEEVGVDAYLMKPLILKTLTDTIRDLLDKQQEEE